MVETRTYPGAEQALLGCLLGLVAGDAMGMPVEFLNAYQIQEQFGWLDRFEAPGAEHFHHGMQAGQITDDSGQALALLQAALAHEGQLTTELVAQALLGWAEALGPDLDQVIGPSTKRALQALRQGASPEESGSQGTTNGASMRAPIAGLLHPGDLEASLECAYVASLPTHGTSVALAGAGAVACAVSVALAPDSTLKDVLQAGEEGARRGAQMGRPAWGTPLSSRIKLACRLVRQAPNQTGALEDLRNYVGVDLLVAESVAAAFGVVLLAKGDPTQAVILGANLGGDTDTIAAIAGAICGAWRGVAALPGSWLSFLGTANQLDLSGLAAYLARLPSYRTVG